MRTQSTSRISPKRGSGKDKMRNLNFCCLMAALLAIGFLFCLVIAPESFDPDVNLHSLHTFSAGAKSKLLSLKVLDWMPQTHTTLHGSSSNQPDWRQEFWTPIDIEVADADPMVTLCKLNFKEHSAAPHLHPMFRDLEKISHCQSHNRRRAPLSTLMSELKAKEGTPEGNVIKPNGFVFHESRVGSTLVANTLASDPFSLVFSESTPPANALLHCNSCSRKKQVQVFRDIITLMGHSPIHQRLFFKFQSITTTKMDIALEAFPDVPFAFVYRSSVQTMMSHLDPAKMSGHNSAPCLRSKRAPPASVMGALIKYVDGNNEPRVDEAWCSVHLQMLCESAVRNYEKYGVVPGSSGKMKQRGLMINYDALPGIVPRTLLPLFNTPVNEQWHSKMQTESKQYSKGRGGPRSHVFSGDSEDKDSRATPAIKKFAKLVLDPTYNRLSELSAESVSAISPNVYALVEPTRPMGAATEGEPPKANWKAISEIPPLYTLPHVDTSTDSAAADNILNNMLPGPGNALNALRGAVNDIMKTHSHAIESKDFVAWSPFSNTHNSKSIAPAHCSEHPTHDYPAAFSMTDMINNWNPDNTDIPAMHYDTLCHFDYQNKTELQYAYNYRKAEKPFIAYNIPELDNVVRKWNNLDYLQRKLGTKRWHTETSKSNHFMYWHNMKQKRGKPNTNPDGSKWEAPTGNTYVPFENWLELAVKGQNKSEESRTHQYFRVSSDMGAPWLFNELPFFQPKESLFMVKPHEQRGIHCRFGMRSIIAEAHFDGSRNAVVEIGGLRRWILAHPAQCNNMHMYPRNHPSGRHSQVDWSKPDVQKYPHFAKVVGNEVILQPGDFLYVPTYWIHYIVSLNVNFQCNTRSGRSDNYDATIKQCGF